MAIIKSRIAALREAVVTITQILSEKNIKVTQRGLEAKTLYHPKTQEVIAVNLPFLPDNASEEVINALQGYLDHEVAHVLFTDMEVFKPIVDKGGIEAFLQNALEDVRIEKLMARRFRGCQSHLSSVMDFVYKNRLDEVLAKTLTTSPDPVSLFRVLLVPILRAYGDQRVAKEYMKDKWDLVEPITQRIGEDLLRRIATLETCEDVVTLHEDFIRKLKEITPPKSSDKGDEGDKSDKGRSGDSSEGESGKGKSKSSKKQNDKSKSDSDESNQDKEGDRKKGQNEKDESEKDESEKDESEKDESEKDESEKDESEKDESEKDESEKDESEKDESEKDESEKDESEKDESEKDESEKDESEKDESEKDESEGFDDEDWRDGDETERELGDENETSTEGEEGEEGEESDITLFDNLSEDLPESGEKMVRDVLRKTAETLMADSEYRVYTKDFDTIEPYPYKTSDRECDAALGRLDAIAREQTGVLQKTLERLIVAQSQSRKLPGQRSGRVNASSLYRLKTGDDRVFSKRISANTRKAAAELLVDCSGSMDGHKYEAALTGAYSLTTVLERLNIPNEVIGFTTHMIPTELQNEHYREQEAGRSYGYWARWEPLNMPIFKGFNERLSTDVKRRFGHAMYPPGGSQFLRNNIDGESLMIAAERLMRRPETGRYLIVLSDGEPNAWGDTGRFFEDLERSIKKVQEMGIHLFAIGIMHPGVQRFYPDSVVIRNISELPIEIIKFLKRSLV
jgi:cobaltochelatase CobT